MIYKLTTPFVIDAAANPRFGDPTLSEVRRAETDKCHRGYNRVIGGDLGDLLFDGYDVEGDKTILHNVAVATSTEKMTDDEVTDLARDIFDFSFESVGIETVEHS